jgi:hypothetical protein
VLVTEAGEIKLVDYDGMFVPAFAGLPSPEDGHPNYQHPCRESRNFGPQLDNFSAWSVYLSILTVARDRTAWEALGFGDDCLALRRADYVRPSASAAFRALEAAADPDVRKIGKFVRSLLAHEPEALPKLENRARFIATSGAGAALDEHAWRFEPFESEPLLAGTYTEPYHPRAAEIPVAVPPPPPPPLAERGHLLARAGGGVAATVASYWVFHALGFTPEQFGAVVLLGWALALILVLSSRGPKPP